MTELNISIAVIALLILITGLYYIPIQKSPVTEPLLAMLLGIAAGPFALEWLDMKHWGDEYKIMEHASRFTIAMALMAAALRLPPQYPFTSKNTQLPLILIGMTLMSLFSGLLVYFVFGLPFMLSMLIGAIIAPTDPVVATTIVSGKVAESHLPERIRNTISGESGANDGLGFPFVLLPVLLIKEPQGAWSEWIFKVLLWETLAGIVVAVIIGYFARKWVVSSYQKQRMSEKVFLSYSLSLAFFTLAFLEIIHCNGIIGVFAAGLTLNYGITRDMDLSEERVQEAIERIFTIPIFFLFGLFIPWKEIIDLGWKALVFPVLILALRRLPAIFLLKPLLKDLKTKKDFWLVGWFGPIGVAAIFYAMHAHKKLHEPELWVLPSLIIFSSTLIHGLTSYPVVALYAKNNARK